MGLVISWTDKWEAISEVKLVKQGWNSFKRKRKRITGIDKVFLDCSKQAQRRIRLQWKYSTYSSCLESLVQNKKLVLEEIVWLRRTSIFPQTSASNMRIHIVTRRSSFKDQPNTIIVYRWPTDDNGRPTKRYSHTLAAQGKSPGVQMVPLDGLGELTVP